MYEECKASLQKYMCSNAILTGWGTYPSSQRAFQLSEMNLT